MRFGFAGLIWGGLGILLMMVGVFLTLPDPVQAINREVRQPSLTLLDRHGNLISRSRGQTSLPIGLKQMPPLLPAAFIAVEDRRFHQHWGIDPLGIARALFVNLRTGRWVQGGSTITQQLAKNLFLTPQKTLWRKVQEAVLALWLESLFTKRQLLEIYLNRLYLGSGVFGVAAAAQQYFHKPVSALDIAEIALLAGLPKAPSRYNPLAHPQRASTRAQTVLKLLRHQGLISTEQYRNNIAFLAPDTLPLRRPSGQYFDLWLRSNSLAYDQVSSYQDVIIETTLDANLQSTIEAQIDALKPYLEAENVGQVAVVSLGEQGAVRAMMGGINWKQSQFNRATQAYRQVGSLFKLMVYAVALESGLTPSSVIALPPYDPSLFAGWWPEKPATEHQQQPHTMRLEEGLAQSSNLMAVHLCESLGRDKVIAMARRFGISVDLPDLPSLALGVAEIPLLQMSQAYQVVAHHGVAFPPYGISAIRTPRGETLYTHTPRGHRVLSPEIAAQLSDMLAAVIQSGTGQQAKSNSIIGGKTGTTNDHRDALFIGYGQHLTTGIWMGNDDGAPMNNTSGGGLPAQLSFMISHLFPH